MFFTPSWSWPRMASASAITAAPPSLLLTSLVQYHHKPSSRHSMQQ
jgi:hypothetical protein